MHVEVIGEPIWIFFGGYVRWSHQDTLELFIPKKVKFQHFFFYHDDDTVFEYGFNLYHEN